MYTYVCVCTFMYIDVYVCIIIFRVVYIYIYISNAEAKHLTKLIGLHISGGKPANENSTAALIPSTKR